MNTIHTYNTHFTRSNLEESICSPATLNCRNVVVGLLNDHLLTMRVNLLSFYISDGQTAKKIIISTELLVHRYKYSINIFEASRSFNKLVCPTFVGPNLTD